MHQDTLEAVDIPVVDLNSPNAPEELLDAAAKHGFIYVKLENIHLEPEQIDAMFNLSRKFFSAPIDVKAECTVNSDKSGKNKGWLSMHTERLDPNHHKKGDFKEAFNIGEFLNDKPQQPFPKPLQPAEKEIGKFWEDCHKLCNRILQLLAVSLKISDGEGGSQWFAHRHDRSRGPSGSILRLLYYPALPSKFIDSGEDIRAGAHSDYGSVTLLFRLPSQPGLEILTPSGKWVPVPVDPVPGSSKSLPILVNVGDLLSFWTNGLLKSTVHRVVFPTASEDQPESTERLSIAFFCHPQDDAKLVAIPSQMIQDRSEHAASNGSDATVMTARDHLNSRLAATYNLAKDKEA